MPANNKLEHLCEITGVARTIKTETTVKSAKGYLLPPMQRFSPCGRLQPLMVVH